MAYERVVSVISKTPDLRQDFEIQGLLPWFRRKSTLFQELKTDYLRDIVRNCMLVSFKKDDVIIRQGERGDCFYIILGGMISIFILNKDKDGAADDDGPVYTDIGALTAEGRLDRSKLGNFVTSLGSGIPFGEVALMSNDCIRTATIIAEENTDLITVDRALYNRAVRDVLKAEFKEKRRFIKQNPLFASWVPKYKKQLAMAMYMESYPYDGVLVRQGEPVNNIYFIVSGQIEFRTDPSLHPVQYPVLFQLLENERDKLIREKRAKPPSEPQPLPPLRKRDHTKDMKLCYLGINESLGEIEVLLGMETYFQTAVCTERTDVLVLEMKHFERLFVKRHQKTIDEMRLRVGMRLNTRNYALSLFSREVPLLKLMQMKLEFIRKPSPPQEKKCNETSVGCAERLFFKNKGPLLDFNGPGSVFYMIRVREKSKMRLKAYQKDRDRFKSKQGRQTAGHLHAIQLPPYLIPAAEFVGATYASDVDDQRMTQEQINEIELVAEQNNPDTDMSDVRMPKLDVLNETGPRSFRFLHSAERQKHTQELDQNGNATQQAQPKYVTSLPATRMGHAVPWREPDIHLGILEARVHEWLVRDNPKIASNVSKLRRLHVEDLEIQPFPGNKVVMRRRARNSNSDSSTATGSSSISTDRSSHRTRTEPTPPGSEDRFRILLTH